MSDIKKIKQRQQAVGRIRKITYAMQIIAQTRLARRKTKTVNARSYHHKIRQILSGIVARSSEIYHPLMQQKQAARVIVLILINSDRGLCGGFNNNVFSQAEDFMRQHPDKDFKFIAVGRKSERFLRSAGKDKIIKRFFDIEKKEAGEISEEVSKDIISLYLNDAADEIQLIYNEYKRNLLGKAAISKILPVEPELLLDEEGELTDYLYEPSAQEVLSLVLPEYICERMYHAVLESRISEEMARMVAMKMATDNADEMIESLQLSYHKARQAMITKELAEIAATV